MTDLKGMQLNIGVLITQSFLLLIVLFLGLFALWDINSVTSNSRLLTNSSVFLIAFACLSVLLSIWILLINFTEEWWSIIAVQRVRKWMVIPLAFATIVGLLASIGFAAASFIYDPAALVDLYSRRIPSAIFAVIIGIPLAGSILLVLAGIKRLIELRKNLKLFQSSVANDQNEELTRVRASIDAENGAGQTFTRPEPKGFYFAGLTSKPWHDPKEFEWIEEFEKSYDRVLAEAKAVMSALGDDIEHYGYQGLNTDNWKKVSLVANRQENQENLAACPVTASLLKKIPGYPVFRDAMFSILEPGGVITPHRDYGNLFLTMHFGLIIPPKGFMEVANMRKPWQAGKAMVFDSAYNHQAVNQSDESRIILLVDFLHPDMNAQERQWVLRAPFWKP